MKTKVIDYSGCHPRIAAELMRGRAVWCKVWDKDIKHSTNVWVLMYNAGIFYSYYSVNNCHANAEPIEPKYRVKDPVALMQALVDGGYACDKSGIWRSYNNTLFFSPEKFHFCGEEVSEDFHRDNWRFLPEWCEEVE